MAASMDGLRGEEVEARLHVKDLRDHARQDPFADSPRSARIGRTRKHKPWPLRISRTFSSVSWIWGGSAYSGVACMALSSMSYSFMGLLVKLLAVQGVPALEAVMVRCVIVSALSGWELRRAGHPLLGSPRVRRLVLARALVGFVALSAYFYSIEALPLRDATVLNFTMPVFTALLAAGLLGERWGPGEMAGSMCSFAGVLLVTQPDLLFPEQGEGGRPPGGRDPLGTFMALVGASAGALSYILVRAVGKQGEPPMVCVFAFAVLSAPLAGLGACFQTFKLPNAIETLGLLGVGLTAFLAQVFLTRGLQLEKAGRATSMQYVKVVATYALGVAFLREAPTAVGAVGALLIAASAAFLACSGAS